MYRTENNDTLNWLDNNNNGLWNDGEGERWWDWGTDWCPDSLETGADIFTDSNDNGKWDIGEPFDDQNENEVWDERGDPINVISVIPNSFASNIETFDNYQLS